MADGVGVRIAGYRLAAGGPGTEIPATATPLPWSHVDSEDADYFSQSAEDITFVKAGHFYIFWWCRIQAAGAAGRRLVLGTLTLNGAPIGQGRSSAYIRGVAGAVTDGMHGRCILDVAAGDVLNLTLQRFDTSAAGNPQLLAATNGRTGISIVRLDESFSYARYQKVGLNLASTAAWSNHFWDATALEEDTAVFELDRPLNLYRIELKETGHYMALATVPVLDPTQVNRTNCSVRFIHNGVQILSPTSDTIRRVDGCDFGVLSMAGIFNVGAAGQWFTLQYTDIGDPFRPGGVSTLELVKLPDMGDYLRLRATTGAHRADGDAFSIPWDAQDEVDAASFTHTVGGSGHEIGLVQDGRYLFFGQGHSTRGGTDPDRLVHRLYWQKESTGVELIRGAATSYDRGNASPANSIRGGTHTCLLSAAGTGADVVSLRHNQDAGGNVDSSCLFDADGLHLQALNLNSIMPLKVEARGLASVHTVLARLGLIAGANMFARGLVSCHARAAPNGIRGMSARGLVSVPAGETPLSGVLQIQAKGARVAAHTAAALGRIRPLSAEGLVSAQAGTAPVAVLRLVSAQGLARMGGRAPLGRLRSLEGQGLAAVHGRAALSLTLGFGIEARGLVTAQGRAALAVIRAALAPGIASAHGSAPLSVTKRVGAFGVAGAHGQAPLAVLRALEAKGLGQVHGDRAILGLFEQIGILARGLITAHGQATMSVIRGVPAPGLVSALTDGAPLSVTRRIEALGLSQVHGIATLGLQAAVAVLARGLVSCHARAALGAIRGLEAQGEADAYAAAELSIIRGAIARGLVGSSGVAGALSILRGLTGRGLFSIEAIANPNKLVEIHARALIQALTLKAALGDAPTLGFYSQTAKVCRVRLRAEWSTPQGISTAYDNLTFARVPDTIHAYSAVIFGPATAEISDLSGPGDGLTATGELQVTIRAPAVGGEQAAKQAGDALVLAFSKVVVGDVHFGSPSSQAQGTVGAFYEVVVHCPFWGEDFRARLAPVGPPSGGDRDSVAETLRTRLREEVATPQGIPAQYQNLGFDRPNNAEWLRSDLTEGGSFLAEQSGQSTGTHRAAGVFFVDASVPFGTGESRLLELVDAIDDAFRVVSVEGVELMEPTVGPGRRLGPDWRRTVAIPYSADITT